MSSFTRVTVIGSERKATMVVPFEEPLAGHLATIADAVAEPYDARRLVLVDTAGRELDSTLSLHDLEVLDGAPLRLVRSSEVPAPPEVSDVTDAVADARSSHSGTWALTDRITIGAIAVGAATFMGLVAVLGDAQWVPLVVWAAAVAVAVGAGMGGARAPRVVFTGVAVGAALASAATVVSWLPNSDEPLLVVLSTAAALVWLTLGFAAGWGGRNSGAATGSLVGLVLSGATATALLFGISAPQVFAIVAVAAVVALGALPSIALAVSGLTRLDDSSAEGWRPRRDAVASRTEDAFAVTTWAVYALALTLAIASAVLLATGELWAQLVAASLVLVTLLRTRVTPLAIQAWPLWIAGLGGALVGVWISQVDVLVWAVPAAVVLLACVMTVADPSSHSRVRMRRWGDSVEALAAVALVPTIVGMFGAYGYMLQVFA